MLSYNLFMENDPSILNGRYQLLARAGSGGMATVHKAQDLLLGRLVAIKLLHENLSHDAEFLRRFQHEARAAANLTHPNIVTVYDISRHNGCDYIVMEYIEGPTLKQIIRDQVTRGDVMPIKRALDLTIQICAGLGYAHRAGLVHCDVKPQNVLVTRDERVKVADFGIARALSQSGFDDPEVIWGTPQYFSPEQAAGEASTPASDVYAIGVILFEMLTGRLPFEASSHTALAIKHMRERPPLVTHFNPAVPQQIEQIIAKVLAKEPTSRYRTADQLGRILSSYRQSTMEETGPVANPRAATQRRPVQRIVVTADELTPPVPRRPQRAAVSENDSDIYIPLPDNQESDWLALVLGLVAIAALLGLIPLWYAVYLQWAG
jgi:eukaryotic-like serine/threonine-protein kinase